MNRRAYRLPVPGSRGGERQGWGKMRNAYKILGFIVAVSLLLPALLNALPIYITVEGRVQAISDGAGLIAEAGYAVNSILSFNLLIDFEREGTFTLNDGSVHPRPSTYGFYAEFISGDILQERDGGFFNAGTDVARYNYGGSGLVFGQLYETYIQLGSQDASLTFSDIASHSFPPENWYVGRRLEGVFVMAAYDSLGNRSWLGGGCLTITDMTTVPEPSALILLGCGLAGVGVFRRKFRKS